MFRLSIPKMDFGDLVLVDTPGFNNTHKSDAEVLKMVADWLKSTYVFVSG
jgi:predicted GTPase